MGEKTKRKSGGHDTKAGKKAKTEDLSSSAQKRQLKKERQSHRRHADTVADAKVLWNKLREKSNTPKDTKELMDQVMTLIRGKVNEIALQHDASRVVQAAIQFGNEEQRKELLKEICADGAAGLAELSKIQYAHFICLKVIKYCNRDPDSIKMIVRVCVSGEQGGANSMSLVALCIFLMIFVSRRFSISGIQRECREIVGTLSSCKSCRVALFGVPIQISHALETRILRPSL
jgi:hypothetical protein